MTQFLDKDNQRQPIEFLPRILQVMVIVSPILTVIGLGISANEGASAVTCVVTMTDTVLETEPPSLDAVTVYLPESSPVA